MLHHCNYVPYMRLSLCEPWGYATPFYPDNPVVEIWDHALPAKDNFLRQSLPSSLHKELHIRLTL